ncbi:TPA: PGF-pre-PGF domain-containing protein, partial [Methanosarcinaceae archaeon]|nr:PGF-pre-PGF domain-containing protein [Methanosarcinaceae archaeon]
SSSSGGSSGGGGGGPPESARNVNKKELAQQFVTNGNRIRFEFVQKATSVGYVEFDAKKSVGKTTTIIEELKGKSTLTPNEPEGKVYKYLNIWVGNGGFANSENIEGAVVGFRVSRAWAMENNVDADSIILQHFSENRWNLLPTTRIGEDEEYIYFEAETPSFSPFAITTSGKSIIMLDQTGGEIDPLSVGTKTQEQETGFEPETPGKFPAGFSKIASFLVGVIMVVMIGLALKKKEEP